MRDGEGIRDGAQQRCVAGGDIGEGRARVERKDQGDTEAARAEDDRSPTGVAAQDRNVAGRAGVQVRPGLRVPVAGKDHGGTIGLPDE